MSADPGEGDVDAEPADVDAEPAEAESEAEAEADSRRPSIPGEVIRDLREMDFVREVLPVDATNVTELRKDVVFWAVAFLGLAPLLVAGLPSPKLQLAGFGLFFATVWGAIIKGLIVRAPRIPMRPLLISFAFSATVGVFLLFGIYDTVVPRRLFLLPTHPNPLVSAVGFILQIGLLEELVKSLPVLWYVRSARRRRTDVLTILLIGVFSGLGFASLENLLFTDKATEQSVHLLLSGGAAGLEQGVYSAMVIVMLRSLSLVFCHGLWSGIFAYFIAVSRFTDSRLGALFIIGLLVSGTLHGLYDWASMRSMIAATSMASVSFMLFYAYMSKLDHTFGVDDSGSRRRGQD